MSISPPEHQSTTTRRLRRKALRDRDATLAVTASAQQGAVSREQLLDIGFSPAEIREATDRSLWPIAPRVFAVGHPGISRLGRAKGVLMYTGEESALSELSSARLWEMVGRGTDGPIHVSMLNRRTVVEPPGVQIHRPRSLTAEDIVVHRGLRVTTPERTIVDLLPTSTVAETSRMLEQMVTHLGRSPDDLHRWGHGLKSVHGKEKLLKALDYVAGPAVIRSEFEALFRSVCQEGGLPIALTNYKLGRWEVDAIWTAFGVAIELDSWRWHGGRWQFHQDRRKGLAISRAGFELLRISWPQLKYQRAEVIEAIHYALARGTARQPA